jgi:hypothetical protein
MRQGQQNRRGRGRNNNNRKSQNPLMRSFESAGPDVKIRGTPSHIAEKYITLARDALSSGDPVLAENYLQHAEHYNRIILSYREQMTQGGMDPLSNGAARTHTLPGPDGNDGDEFGDDEGDEFGIQPQQSGGQGDAPQQSFPQQPRNYDNQNRYDNRQPRHDNRGDQQRFNNNRNDRGDNQRYDRNDRGDRQDFRGDRNGPGGGGENRYRDDRRPHGNGGDGNQGDGGFRRRERYQGPNNGGERDLANGGFQAPSNLPPANQPLPQPVTVPERPSAPPQTAAQPPVEQQEQPAFLRRPVRRPRREEPAEEQVAPTPAVTEDQD